ncbi:alpha/beta hydrolase [Nakamurella leprariae]|uniref:Alpha/beta hydrolase n=1 Tax=Nakamurella leprariae TaxID=2803911 RepID=A0A939C2E7_9ACTN|nr:alpha/beta hydrolase [Nakamurella leprariae]MBM9468042.1 alpha/beta hydrolase [Nakamurella leprariae]
MSQESPTALAPDSAPAGAAPIDLPTGPPAGAGFQPDVLGEGYESLTVPLGEDDEGPVVVTVVRRRAGSTGESAAGPTAAPNRDGRRAVLYVHGLNDYFFQTELAEQLTARTDRPTDFYAVDLRKCGRSWRPGQTPHWTEDLGVYAEDLDAALAVIQADGHDRVTVLAHSTGALSSALWLAGRRSRASEERASAGSDHAAPERTGRGAAPVTSLVLNSPLLELNAHWAVRAGAAPSVTALARVRPRAVLPVGVSELYGRSLHTQFDGEWTYDLTMKTLAGLPVRAGWLAAVLAGLRQAHRGLELPVPILVMCSSRTVVPKVRGQELFTGDAVLNAEAIARRATALGPRVTCLRIADGMHDLVLSRPPVRAAVYGELHRWLDAYGDG